jgi:hypothetical protein
MPARECPRCGCQGHGTTYAVICTRCGKQKFPSLRDRPDPRTWVCSLCLSGASEARRKAGSKGAAKKARLRKLGEATAVA